jgi:hypothetical protein
MIKIFGKKGKEAKKNGYQLTDAPFGLTDEFQ